MSRQFPDRPGAAYVATCQRGAAEVCVYPLLFGGGRILLGPTGEKYDGGGDGAWDYERLDDAISAAHRWDGVGEPPDAYRRVPAAGPPVKLRPLRAAAG